MYPALFSLSLSPSQSPQRYREYLGPALPILSAQVENTLDEIRICRRASETYAELHRDWREKRISVSIMHPTDTALNIVLIICHSLKLGCILFAICISLYVGKTGPYPDPELPFRFKPPHNDDELFAVSLSVSYACVIVEIVMKLFTGYIDRGRTIMDETLIRHHYKTKLSLMTLDILSLIPSPFIYLLPVEPLYTFFRRYSEAVLLLYPPQIIQIYRTVKYFTLPRQAEPFSATVLTAKTVMRICLQISTLIITLSLLLLYASCSVLQPSCRFTWIEFAHKTYDVTTNMDIFGLSVYFTITTLVTTGYGDLTAHVVLERYTLSFIMALCMIVVAICQAKITTSIFKVAARSRMYTDRIETLRMALEANQVQDTITSRVMGYLRVAYGQHGGKQMQTLLKDLHPSLRKEVHYVICQDFIGQLPFFHDLPLGVHQYVALFVDACCYLPGDVIVARGDVVSSAYYVSQGVVSLRRPRERTGAPMKEGSVIFRESLVRPNVTGASLVAESLTIVYFLEYEDFSRIIYSLSQVAEEQCMAKVRMVVGR